MLEISRENISNDDDGGMLNGSEQKNKKNNLFREKIQSHSNVAEETI